MALRNRIWKSGLINSLRFSEESFDEVGTSDAAQFVDDLLLLVAFVPEEELTLGEFVALTVG